jgi:hypothetical protein
VGTHLEVKKTIVINDAVNIAHYRQIMNIDKYRTQDQHIHLTKFYSKYSKVQRIPTSDM